MAAKPSFLSMEFWAVTGAGIALWQTLQNPAVSERLALACVVGLVVLAVGFCACRSWVKR